MATDRECAAVQGRLLRIRFYEVIERGCDLSDPIQRLQAADYYEENGRDGAAWTLRKAGPGGWFPRWANVPREYLAGLPGGEAEVGRATG
jgi:hypothetical protein